MDIQPDFAAEPMPNDLSLSSMDTQPDFVAEPMPTDLSLSSMDTQPDFADISQTHDPPISEFDRQCAGQCHRRECERLECKARDGTDNSHGRISQTALPQNSRAKKIKVHAGVRPALAYAGDPPGKDFVPTNVQEGCFQDYLLKRVLRHIYTSPSSALIDDREKTTVRSGNTKLHNMQKVEVEHIAYAFIQARYGISSCDKWSGNGGKYSYCNAILLHHQSYSRSTRPRLGKVPNNAVFGNKKCVLDFNLSENKDKEDDYALMKKQFAMRTAKGRAEPGPVNARANKTHSETSMMDASTTASTSRREPEDLIVSPPARPVPRPRPVKPTIQCGSSSSSAHVPSALTLPPAQALTPTDHLPKPTSVSTVSHTVVSKKCPSAEFLGDSDSPLTEAESVAPSPTKCPKPGKRAKAGESSKSAGEKHKG
ncbi:hypothetical protein F4604DRAFT_1973369 [Suillus subluteus]|nr:hypothetical protein F4604DRAFT_1973369 [Suillus subluteus]